MLLHRARTRLVSPFQFTWPARAGLAAMVVAAIATLFLDSDIASIVLALTVLVALAVSSVNFLRRSDGLEANEQRAWKLLGAGFGIAATGVLALAIMTTIEPNTPAMGPADLPYLAGYGFALAGFAALPHTYGTGLQRIRLLLDGLIGAVAAGTLLWVVFLNQVTSALGDAPIWQRLVGSTYVVLDVAILVVLMIVIVRRSNLRFDLRLMLFGFGAVAFAAANVSWLVSAAGRSFSEADPIYALYIIAMALFLATSMIVDRTPTEKEYADRSKTPLWAMALPYGSATIMVALLVTRFPRMTSNADASLLHATLTIGALVIARQAVAIRENRRLIDNQQTALVSSISHELRTPLTAMVGFLELLDAGAIDDPAERDEMTSIVSDQASYLSRIVSDLIMLASDNIVRMDLEIAPTAIDDLAWSSINTSAVDTTSVRVHAQRNIIAFVDPGRMQQALANLLSNAARYGGEKALIVAHAESGNLVIEVHDDGPGVPRKFELLIWEKFERGLHRLDAAVPGSGIGLAVTNAIAQAHGGTAGYRRSERLGGACFWIRLPGRVHGVGIESPTSSRRLSVVDGAQTA